MFEPIAVSRLRQALLLVLLLSQRWAHLFCIHKEERTMDVLVEIRAGEGGDHSKKLVIDQFGVYKKYEFRSCL